MMDVSIDVSCLTSLLAAFRGFQPKFVIQDVVGFRVKRISTKPGSRTGLSPE